MNCSIHQREHTKMLHKNTFIKRVMIQRHTANLLYVRALCQLIVQYYAQALCQSVLHVHQKNPIFKKWLKNNAVQTVFMITN